jgi:hypothetical protein
MEAADRKKPLLVLLQEAVLPLTTAMLTVVLVQLLPVTAKPSVALHAATIDAADTGDDLSHEVPDVLALQVAPCATRMDSRAAVDPSLASPLSSGHCGVQPSITATPPPRNV